MSHNIDEKTMNKVYDMLKKLTLIQLEEYKSVVMVGYGSKLPILESEILLNQVNFTIDKKKNGKW